MMNHEEVIFFLQNCELTEHLSVEEIGQLLPFIEQKFIETNEVILNEGDESRELYLIKSGTVEVFKKVDEFEKSQQFKTLTSGDFFGEMAHLANEKRSASVRSLERAELLIFHLDDLQKVHGKELLYSKIVAQLGKKVSQHLRNTDRTVIESLKEKLKILQVNSQISKTLVHIIVLMAVWFNLSNLVRIFPAYRHALDLIFTVFLLILFTFSVYYLIKSSGYPILFYGLTLHRWLRNAIESLLYTLPVLIFFIFLKWVLVSNVEMFKGMSIFASWEYLKSVYVFALIYIVLSPVQELIARGCIQSSFQFFFQGPHRAFLAILTSNLVFQMLHTVKEFWLAVASLFLGFFWGYLFEKQKSLVGVSISHAIIGAFAFFVLEFDTIKRMLLTGE